MNDNAEVPDDCNECIFSGTLAPFFSNILKEENYAKKIVELSKIREKMMYFLYEVKKNTELNYSDIKGSIIYIDDGDKYFTDGIYTGGEGDMFI